jgi:tetratricopeptide (TPR) repeat protein
VHLAVSRVAGTWTWVALAIAQQYEKSGDEDRAILILGQATAKDPEFYGSYEMLGDIYARRGNRQLALEMYNKALETFDHEHYLPPGRIAKDEKESIAMKIQALEKAPGDKRSAPPK